MPTTLLRLPDSPRPASYKITKQSNVLVSSPIVGAHRSQTRLIGEDYHMVSLTYDPMSRDEYAPLVTFLNGLQGQHTRFEVTIPNFSRSANVLEQGNYVSLSNGRCVQILDAGFVSFNQVSGTTSPAPSVTYSNSIAVESGVPIGVYFDATDIGAAGTCSLRATKSETDGSLLSTEVMPITNGRNFIKLVPTATQNLYIQIRHGNTTSVKNLSAHIGQRSAAATLSPSSTPADAGAYLIPGQAAVLSCSLAKSGVSVTYGADSFIKVKLDLVERQA